LYNLDYILIWHLLEYSSDNFFCLLYGFEFILSRSMFLLTYFDLLADISEVFGVWITISILAMSTITTMTTIQEITATPKTLIDPNSSLLNFSKTNNFVNYKFFYNFFFLKKFLYK
jgi:hypothetical protein